MRSLLRRLRGVLGLSAVGGVLGAVLGAAADALFGLLQGGTPFFGSMTVMATVWGLFGAMSAGGFGVLLTLTRRGSTIADLSTARAAILGAAIGSLFPYVFQLSFGSLTASGLASLLPIAALCAALGAGLTSTLVIAAKRSARSELANNASPLLAPVEDNR